MDGPWQIGHLDMDEYARKAREAAKMMRWHDPLDQADPVRLFQHQMPTYPEWDRVALETCCDQVDYLSLHYYVEERDERHAQLPGAGLPV